MLAHLARLTRLRDTTADPARRLQAVAAAYAQICSHRARHGSLELSTLTHQRERVAGAEQQLLALFEEVLVDAAAADAVRADTPAAELAVYCVHALASAEQLASQAAVQRLVTITLAALEPRGQ